MALVDEDECVVREIFKQRRRRLAGLAAGKIARVIFDAGAGTGRRHHLHIKNAALLEALCLEQAAGPIELL